MDVLWEHMLVHACLCLRHHLCHLSSVRWVFTDNEQGLNIFMAAVLNCEMTLNFQVRLLLIWTFYRIRLEIDLCKWLFS